MRIRSLLCLLMALPLFFVACEDPEPGVDKPAQKEYAAELTLTSDAEMNFEAVGGEGEITYTAKMVEVTRESPAPQPEVEATCEAEWVTDLAVAEKITFKVAANDGEARDTKVVVTYGDKSFEVAVKQAAKPAEKEYAAELTLTSDAEMNFDAAGGEGEITYTAKMVEVTRESNEPKVEATCEAKWVTDLTVAEKITFKVAANEGEARDTKVVVTYGDKSFEVVVKQAAKQNEQPEPEYVLDVELAAAMRIPSAELDLSDNNFVLFMVDDAEIVELGIVLVGAEGDTILQPGEYVSEDGSFMADGCELYVWEPTEEYYRFVEGTATVALEGDIYSLDIELLSEDEEYFHFTYEGTILDMEPAAKPEPVDFEPVKVAAYREADWDLGNFELQLYIDDSLYHALDMQDDVNPNDKYLSAGDYSYPDTIGYWSNFVANVETGAGAYLADAEIELTHNEDGTSTIYGFIESEDGQRLNIDWTGVIAGFDFSAEGGDTSDGIEVNATGWTVRAEYDMNWYNYDTDRYMVYLYEENEESGRCFQLELLVDFVNAVDYSGTFTSSTDYGINTFLPGTMAPADQGGYRMGSWYGDLDKNEWVPLKEGTIEVTYNSDSTKTIVIDCKDDKGNKVIGNIVTAPKSN